MILPLYTFGTTIEQFAAMRSGDLVRYGTILKDSQTGKIVAHIQETGLWRSALDNVVHAPSNPVLSVFNTIQNEQIKSRLTGLETMVGGLQNLQLVNLAASVVGIGVTVASTAIILKRLNVLGKTTDRILSAIDDLPAVWERGRVREHIADMQTSLERLEEAPTRRDSDQVIRNVEEALHSSFCRISNIALNLSLDARVDADLLRILLAAMSTSAGAQYRAMLFLDEKRAAFVRARNQYNTVEKLSWNFPLDVLKRKTGEDADVFEAISSDMNEMRARLACRPCAIETMISQGIRGRDVIDQAEGEMEEGLLLLPIKEE